MIAVLTIIASNGNSVNVGDWTAVLAIIASNVNGWLDSRLSDHC